MCVYDTVLPLNLDNIMESIKNICEEWHTLSLHLGIPEAKVDFVTSGSSSNEESLTAVVKEWLEGGGLPASWRRLIWSLYKMDKITIANELTSCAEPVPGKWISREYLIVLIYTQF